MWYASGPHSSQISIAPPDDEIIFKQFAPHSQQESFTVATHTESSQAQLDP